MNLRKNLRNCIFLALSFGCITGARASDTSTLLRREDRGLLGAMYRMNCGPLWLSAVMDASGNIQQKDLKVLPPNMEVVLPNGCEGVLSRQTVSTTKRIFIQIASENGARFQSKSKNAAQQKIAKQTQPVNTLNQRQSEDSKTIVRLNSELEIAKDHLEDAQKVLAERREHDDLLFVSGVGSFIVMMVLLYFIWLKRILVVALRTKKYRKGREVILCHLGHLRYKVEDKYCVPSSEDEVRENRLPGHIAKVYPHVGVTIEDDVSHIPESVTSSF